MHQVGLPGQRAGTPGSVPLLLSAFLKPVSACVYCCWCLGRQSLSYGSGSVPGRSYGRFQMLPESWEAMYLSVWILCVVLWGAQELLELLGLT